MTTAGLHRPALGNVPPPAAGTRRDRAAAGWRLARLYLVSRRVPMALALLAGLGALQWAALHWHWNIAGGAAARLFIPLTIQSGAAAVITVTTYEPFGEPERATGRWLPWLRLGAAVALTAVAFGALAAGAAAGGMPGGTLALLRNLGGMAGIGLLSAAVLGGAFGWIGPMAYLRDQRGGAGPPLGHAMGLADPAAARPRRGDLRGPGIRRRDSGHHYARRPGPRRRVRVAADVGLPGPRLGRCRGPRAEPPGSAWWRGLAAAADDRYRRLRSVIVAQEAGVTRAPAGRWMVACARPGSSRRMRRRRERRGQ